MHIYCISTSTIIITSITLQTVEVETEKKIKQKSRLVRYLIFFSALSFGVNFFNSATLTHYRDEHEVYTVPKNATDPRPMFFLKK